MRIIRFGGGEHLRKTRLKLFGNDEGGGPLHGVHHIPITPQRILIHHRRIHNIVAGRRLRTRFTMTVIRILTITRPTTLPTPLPSILGGRRCTGRCTGVLGRDSRMGFVVAVVAFLAVGYFSTWWTGDGSAVATTTTSTKHHGCYCCCCVSFVCSMSVADSLVIFFFY